MTTTLTTTRSRRLRRAAALGAAVAVGLALWLIAVPLLGADLAVTSPGGTTAIGPAAVIATCLVVGLVGWGSLALLERLTTGAGRIWTVLALAVTVVSLLGPLGQAVSLPATLALVAMHLGVAAALIGLLPAGAGDRRRATGPSDIR